MISLITILYSIMLLAVKILVAPIAVTVSMWAVASCDHGEWIPEDERYAPGQGNPAGVVILALIGAFALWIWLGEITGYDIAIAMCCWAVMEIAYFKWHKRH